MLGYANPADNANENGLATVRLREPPPAINAQSRTSRKRKSPPEGAEQQAQAQAQVQVQQQAQQQQMVQQAQQVAQQQQQQPQPAPQPAPPPQQPQMHHVLPPMMPPHMGAPLPPGYHYDFTPGGMPHPPPPPQQQPQPDQSGQAPPPNSAAGRALSSSKRAEQNRKAQRAFRERRDQHVKALESRSQLLDAALASADEANRRWEECRALVDQLRVENAALRAALSQAQLLPAGAGGPQQQLQQQAQQSNGNGNAQSEEEAAARSLEAVINELKGKADAVTIPLPSSAPDSAEPKHE